MKGNVYSMKQGKCLIVCLITCSMFFCSCSKEEKKNETVKEPKKEVIEETAESIEQDVVVDFEPEKGYVVLE